MCLYVLISYLLLLVCIFEKVVDLKFLLCMDGQVYDFTAEDLIDQGEIGHGNYGTVNKMYYERSGTLMAVKVLISGIELHSNKNVYCCVVLLWLQCCVENIQCHLRCVRLPQ